MPGETWTFESRWVLPAATDVTWTVLADPTSWPLWWPGLRSQVVRAGDDDGVGTRGALAFLAPGYRLRLGLEVVTAQVPRSAGERGAVVLRAVGDLRGSAVARLGPTGGGGSRDGGSRDGSGGGSGGGSRDDGTGGTILDITWRVAPTHAGLARAQRWAPWSLRASHAVVMRAGEQGLRRYLR